VDLAYLPNYLLVAGWMLSCALGLYLVKRRVPQEDAAGWVLVVLLIPFVGTAALLYAGPRSR
jgi:hypothetical protein